MACGGRSGLNPLFGEVVEEHLNTLEQHMESRFEAQDKKLDQILLLLNPPTPKPDQET